MDNFTEWKAAERRVRDKMRRIVEELSARMAPGHEDEVSEIFQPILEMLDATEAADEAIAADLLAQVDLDGRRSV